MPPFAPWKRSVVDPGHNSRAKRPKARASLVTDSRDTSEEAQDDPTPIAAHPVPRTHAHVGLLDHESLPRLSVRTTVAALKDEVCRWVCVWVSVCECVCVLVCVFARVCACVLH